MEDTLQQANFEPIDLDSSGKFSFTNCLIKLRRSIVGLHNKIFPVFIMNDVANPVNVSIGIANHTPNVFLVGASCSNATITVGTVPAGKKWHVLSYSMQGYGNATGADNTLKLGTNTVEKILTTGTATTLHVINLCKVFPFDTACLLVAGDTITSISSSNGSVYYATALIFEENA